jgi:2-phosphoglycerate kinase
MQTIQSQPEWKVLLIGGSSGLGKTTMAQAVARHFGISTLLVDDIRLALQQITLPDQQPGLHVFSTDQEAAQRSPEQIRDGLIEVGQAILPALKIIMAHHVVVDGVGPIVIEGDGILPQLASQQEFGELKHFWGLRTEREIRALFLFEPEEEIIFQNFLKRGRGFQELAPKEQRQLVHASWLYGQWLSQEVQRYQLPLIPVRPYETLLERVLEIAE